MARTAQGTLAARNRATGVSTGSRASWTERAMARLRAAYSPMARLRTLYWCESASRCLTVMQPAAGYRVSCCRMDSQCGLRPRGGGRYVSRCPIIRSKKLGCNHARGFPLPLPSPSHPPEPCSQPTAALLRWSRLAKATQRKVTGSDGPIQIKCQRAHRTVKHKIRSTRHYPSPI